MNAKEQAKRDYELAIARLGMSWLDAYNRFQAQHEQFPPEWTEQQKYYFAQALAAVRLHNYIELNETPSK